MPVRRALTEFVQEVRRAGIRVSVAEAIDALRAAAVIGVEREPLREALAATIVKDESDRPLFDDVFDRFFAASSAGRTRKEERAAQGEGTGSGGGQGRSLTSPRRGEVARSAGEGETHVDSQSSPPHPGPLRNEERRRAGRGSRGEAPVVARRRRRRALLAKPFRELDPLDAEEMTALGEALARRFRGRLRRRVRRARRGRLDFRRTLRRSIGHGGVAFALELRRRRPGRIDLVALCDVSGSVRHASAFFAAVLGPCADLLRSLHVVAFVDRPIAASIESGEIVPDEPIDFHAFSDLGRVLVEIERTPPRLGRNTVLVVLGDARNNRKPARADRLARLRSRVRALWWLNPEARERWGGGDSAIASYRPHCDALLECATPAALLAALDRLPIGR